jgi:hypothetical protein
VNTPAIWSRFKSVLKTLGPVYYANAQIKARTARTARRQLLAEYDRVAGERGVTYSESAAVAAFRARLGTSLVRPNPHVGGLRLMWVGSNYEQDHSGLLQSLRRLGEVYAYYHADGKYGPEYPAHGRYDAVVARSNSDALIRQVREAHASGALDLLIGQMWRWVYEPDVFHAVRELGIPVVNISMDDRLTDLWQPYRGLRLGAVGLRGAVDMVLTSCPETTLWYAVEGMPALFFPMASDPRIYRPHEPTRYDVTFVGSRYGIRERIVETLREAGIPIEVFGSGWPNGAVSSARAAEIFGQSRIVLGVGSVAHNEDIRTLKLRDFDAPMAGALYITHRNPDLASLYQEDEEIVLYETATECTEKIRFYLDREDERARIAQAGLTRARASHTWDARLGVVLKRLGLVTEAL